MRDRDYICTRCATVFRSTTPVCACRYHAIELPRQRVGTLLRAAWRSAFAWWLDVFDVWYGA